MVLILFAGIAFSQMLIDKEGNLHSRTQGKYQKPKEIVDTMRIANGIGYWALSDKFTRNKHTTSPTKQGIAYGVATGIITDTSQAVASYAVFVNSNKDTLIIKSSSATDSGLVAVRVIIK